MVSTQVLERLAQTLRLDANEREHLFHLAQQQPPPGGVPADQRVSPMVQHFLDQLETSPAYVTGERWDIVAWNEAACAVFGDFSQMTPKERNAVWRMFLSSAHRHLVVNWEENARHLVAQFRASYGRFLGDGQLAELLDDLMAHSPEFRAWWPDYAVYRMPEGNKIFHHPTGGYMEFEHVTFDVYAAPALKVTVYTAAEGTETQARLNRLLHLSQRG